MEAVTIRQPPRLRERRPSVSEANTHALDRQLDSTVLKGGSASGPVSVNEYGWGIDDLCLLPDLRSLTVVKGVEWPERVRRYLRER